jgi:transposase
MIHITNETQILLATLPADFRKGMDGFIALCRLSLAQDPRSKARFVFINKSKTMVRVLSYDGTGFWLMTKRLSKGKFLGWPKQGDVVSTYTAKQLSQMLKGKPVALNYVKNAA